MIFFFEKGRLEDKTVVKILKIRYGKMGCTIERPPSVEKFRIDLNLALSCL